jgi:hypothetical protein
MDARIRFTTADEPSAELPFEGEETDVTTPVLAYSNEDVVAAEPSPLEVLRAKVDRAELLARQAEANLRVATSRAELIALREKA